MVSWEGIYRRDGFVDRSITFDSRLTKASEHYANALEYYRRAELQELAAAKYDALTNVYYNMAWSHLALGAQDEACADFDRTLQAYSENMGRNINVHPNGPRGGGTIPDAVARAKRQAGCRDATQTHV